MFASPGVERRTVGVARPPRLPRGILHDFAPRAKAGIGQPLRGKPCEGAGVLWKMLGLTPNRHFPREPQPCKILINRLLEFHPAALNVDILDSQQKAAFRRARQSEIQHGGIGMAKVKIAIRRRRTTENAVGKGPGHVLKAPGRPAERQGKSCLSWITIIRNGVSTRAVQMKFDGWLSKSRDLSGHRRRDSAFNPAALGLLCAQSELRIGASQSRIP